MAVFTNISKTPTTQELLDAVIQDGQNRVFMNGDNKIYRPLTENNWSNLAKST